MGACSKKTRKGQGAIPESNNRCYNTAGMRSSPERFALTFPQDTHFCISKWVLIAGNLRGVLGLWLVVSFSLIPDRPSTNQNTKSPGVDQICHPLLMEQMWLEVVGVRSSEDEAYDHGNYSNFVGTSLITGL